MDELEILDRVIIGLDRIPKPKDGDITEMSKYIMALNGAFHIVLRIRFVGTLAEKRILYNAFDEYITTIINLNKQ